MGYGTGAIMAVPAHDQRDFEFAREFELPIVPVIRPSDEWLAEHGVDPDDATDWPEAYVGDGVVQNSANDEVSIDGLRVDEAKRVIIEWLERSGYGHPTVTYKLRDWLFSRQRYWGEPFPIVYDDAGPIALPEEMLPVVLPEVTDFEPVTSDDPDALPEPPLARATDWVEVELDLPGASGPATAKARRIYLRETNTMPQWAGSCWYYLRYLDPTNEDALVDPEVEAAWGAGTRLDGDTEGRSRRPLRRRRGTRGPAPLVRALLAQGAVRPRVRVGDRAVRPSGQPGLHPRGRVRRRPGRLRRRRPGRGARRRVLLRRQGRSPASSARWARACATRSRPTRSTATTAPTRCVSTRCSWARSTRSVPGAPPTSSVCIGSCSASGATSSTRRRARRGCPTTPPTTKLVACCTARSTACAPTCVALSFNTAIARLFELNNHLTTLVQERGILPREVAVPLALMVAPLAPHVAEELWARLGHDDTLTYESFPTADPQWLVDDRVEVPVQINNKVRARVAGCGRSRRGRARGRGARRAAHRGAAAGRHRAHGQGRPRQDRELRRRLTILRAIRLRHFGLAHPRGSVRFLPRTSSQL